MKPFSPGGCSWRNTTSLLAAPALMQLAETAVTVSFWICRLPVLSSKDQLPREMTMLL